MKVTPKNSFKYGAPLLLSAAALLAPLATLSAATSDPVGYTTITPAPAVGGVRSYTVASFPLTDAPVFAGAVTSASTTDLPGREGEVVFTGTTFSSDSFAVGTYVSHVLVSYSGETVGTVYPILGNTDTVITVDLPEGVDDLSAALPQDATVRVVPVNTIRKIFGDSAKLDEIGWQKGTTSNSADIVYLWGGSAWVPHYFTTAFSGRWRSTSPTDVADFPIYPDRPVWISRISTGEMKIVIDGSVQMSDFAQSPIPGPTSGTDRIYTFVSNPYPKTIELQDFGFKASLNNPSEVFNWKTANVSNQADIVYIWSGGAWVPFWYTAGNPGNWRNSSGPTNRNAHPIESGSGVWVARLSQGSNTTTYSVKTKRLF